MESIQKWLSDPNRDYLTGVQLFAMASRNKNLVRYFQSGTAKFRMAKLVYEMGKLVKSGVKIGERVVQAVRQPAQKSLETKPDVPDIILAAKKEISSLYAIIDKKHSELYSVGTSNSRASVQKRKKILDDRQPVIERADALFKLKEEWFILKSESARRKVERAISELLTAPEAEQPSISVGPKEKVGTMSDLELSKRRNQLRSSITKTRNMLDFQSIRKADTPSPMPEGPKRAEFQFKLDSLTEEFNAVQAEMERRKI